MKKLFLFALLFLSNLSFAQWNEQNSGTSIQLTDVRFLNDNEGFVVGNTKILKTLNGGTNWLPSYNCSYYLEAIEFTQSRIHVVGYNLSTGESMYLQSNTNGASWNEAVLPTAGLLYDIFFPSDLIGYTIGSQGVLLKTIDGGISWDSHGTGISSMIQALYFLDENHGFAVGGFSGGYMFETTDGGLTWNELSINASSFLQGITFSSPSIGYTVGWDGDIFKTTDGGVTWLQQTPVEVYGNLDLCFTDNSTGYIVGGDSQLSRIQKTTDGGTTWFSQNPTVSQGLIGVHFPSSSVGYAVGAGGTILNTSNSGGLSIAEIENSSSQVEVYPNPTRGSFDLKIISETLEIQTIEVISDKGKVVYNEAFNQHKAIDVSHLENGIYLVRINFPEHSIIEKLYKM